MANYKILKQVDGLENVLNTARHEIKGYFNKDSCDVVRIRHYQRFEAICETLKTLGIVDNLTALMEEMWDNGRETQKQIDERKEKSK